MACLWLSLHTTITSILHTTHTFFVDTGPTPHMGFEPAQSPTKVEAVSNFANRKKGQLSARHGRHLQSPRMNWHKYYKPALHACTGHSQLVIRYSLDAI